MNYSRLNQAILSCRSNEVIMAEDINITGAKCFYVNELRNLNQVYLPKINKYWYEVLVENKPSRLFLDIESVCCKVDIERLVGIFAECLLGFLRSKGSPIVPVFEVLDSSSIDKSSFHVICTNVYFQNIYHVGAFVRRVVCKMVREEEDYSSIDTAVYTKNRMFRVKGSTKIGSQRVLKHHKPWDLLLVQSPSPVSNVLSCNEIDSSCPVSTSMHPNDIFEYNEERERWVSKVVTHNDWTDTVLTDCPLLIPIFDFLDSEIDAEIKRYDQRLSPEKGTLFINSGSRTCAIRNAVHRGNHIWFKIDINRQQVFQHCHDNDCKKTRCNVPNSDRHLFGKVIVPVPKSCWDLWNCEWEKTVPFIEDK